MVAIDTGAWRVPTISAQTDGPYLIEGDLIFSTVSTFLNASLAPIREAGAAPVFDLAGVSRADSAGLALLIEWLRHARQLNKTLQFEHIPEQLLNMALASGLETLLGLPASD